jgi:hypothetical protein
MLVIPNKFFYISYILNINEQNNNWDNIIINNTNIN